MRTTTLDPLLTREQAAAHLGLKPQTLAVWAMKGEGPRYIRLGSRVRYRVSDIEAFLLAQTVETEQ